MFLWSGNSQWQPEHPVSQMHTYKHNTSHMKQCHIPRWRTLRTVILLNLALEIVHSATCNTGTLMHDGRYETTGTMGDWELKKLASSLTDTVFTLSMLRPLDSAL